VTPLSALLDLSNSTHRLRFDHTRCPLSVGSVHETEHFPAKHGALGQNTARSRRPICRGDGSRAECRDHAQSEAEALVREGLQRFKLAESDLEVLPGSDPRKVAIADSIHKSTTTPLGWTAERLKMKSAANVSQQLNRQRRRQPEPPSFRKA